MADEPTSNPCQLADELPPLPVFPAQLHDCLTPTEDRLVRRLMREYAAAAVARERERIVDIVLIELDCNGQAGWPAYNGERMCK